MDHITFTLLPPTRDNPTIRELLTAIYSGGTDHQNTPRSNT